MATTSFKDIIAWQKAHEFVLMVYKACKLLPPYERFNLYSQFTRAAVSVPANIAEGHKKLGRNDKLRLMNVGQGSLEECRYYIILCQDLGYFNEATSIALDTKAQEVSRLLTAYCKGIIRNSGVSDNF